MDVPSPSTMESSADAKSLESARNEIFKKLLKYFPMSMKQPDADLMDFVTIYDA